MSIIGGLFCVAIGGIVCGFWIGYHSKSKRLKGGETQ